MDGIESAIRNALARGDVGDRAFRERVYRSVFAALERKMAATPGIDAGDAQRRREVLKQHIVVIEREFVPRRAEPASVPPVAASPVTAPPVAGPQAAAPVASAAPPLGGADRRAPAAPAAPPVEMRPADKAPAPAAPDSGMLSLRPHRDGPAADLSLPGLSGDLAQDAADEAVAERRRPWGALVGAVALVALLGAGGWWAWQAGFAGGEDGPATPPGLEDGAPDAPPPLSEDAAAEREWITLFSAADPAGFTPAAGASAEAMEEAEGVKFVRLRSARAGAAVAFTVDRGSLAALAGRPVVFDIVARAQEGQETQISVTCDFGVLGDCGRRRYLVGLHREDFLFEVDLGAGSPSADGSIMIVTDVDGGGKAVDLFEIRAAPAQ